MVRVRSRGGADTSALSLRERTTVSENFRFAVTHVAEALIFTPISFGSR